MGGNVAFPGAGRSRSSGISLCYEANQEYSGGTEHGVLWSMN